MFDRLFATLTVVLLFSLAVTGVTAQSTPPPEGLHITFRGIIEATDDETITIEGREIDIAGLPMLTRLQPGMIVEVNAVLTPENTVNATTILIFAGGAEAAPATPAPKPEQACPYSPGYWLEDPDLWAADTVMLGTQSYTKAELLTLLNMPVNGDVSINLGYEIIGAKLNIAHGVDAAPIGLIVIAADSLLARFEGKLPYNVPADSEVGQAMTALITNLNRFNNNGFTPECAASALETDTIEEVISMQGSIQTIAENIVTVLGVSVWFDPNDPVLPTLKVGDTVLIEGFVGQGEMAGVIVAVRTTVLPAATQTPS